MFLLDIIPLPYPPALISFLHLKVLVAGFIRRNRASCSESGHVPNQPAMGRMEIQPLSAMLKGDPLCHLSQDNDIMESWRHGPRICVFPNSLTEQPNI